MQAPNLWCHVQLHWCRLYWRDCVGHLWESQEHHSKWTNMNCMFTYKWSSTFLLHHFSYFETMCWMTIMYWSRWYSPLSHGPTNLALTMWEWGPHCYIYMGTAVHIIIWERWFYDTALVVPCERDTSHYGYVYMSFVCSLTSVLYHGIGLVHLRFKFIESCSCYSTEY